MKNPGTDQHGIERDFTCASCGEASPILNFRQCSQCWRAKRPIPEPPRCECAEPVVELAFTGPKCSACGRRTR